MKTKKWKMRSQRGTLLCEIAYIPDGRKFVQIKNHGIFTLIELPQDGGSPVATDHIEEVKL